MNQPQHRAGQKQHGNDGNAFENDQDEAGATRGNDAERRDHQSSHHRQGEAGCAAPEIEPVQKVGAEQTNGPDADDREAKISPEQHPSGHQPGAGTQDRGHESIGGARIGMITGQSRKAPRHQQHDKGGQCEDERDHPADMLGRLLRIQVHGQGGSHAGDRDGDGIPGADTLEQDDGRIDRGTMRHVVKLA